MRAIHGANPDLGAPDPAHDRIFVLATGDCAVIGRAETQRRIREMAGPTRSPVLYLGGAPRSGKTFSADLIRDSVESGRHVIVTLSPSQVPPAARDLAALILIRAGATPELAATLPGADTPHGTDVAWLGGKLFPEFRRLLHETLQVGTSGPRLLWLVMDQLDQGDIP